jgi:hypothetical protein
VRGDRSGFATEPDLALPCGIGAEGLAAEAAVEREFFAEQPLDVYDLFRWITEEGPKLMPRLFL